MEYMELLSQIMTKTTWFAKAQNTGTLSLTHGMLVRVSCSSGYMNSLACLHYPGAEITGDWPIFL